MKVLLNPERNELATKTPEAKLIQALLAIGVEQTLNAGNLQLQILKIPSDSDKKRGCFKNSEPQAPA